MSWRVYSRSMVINGVETKQVHEAVRTWSEIFGVAEVGSFQTKVCCPCSLSAYYIILPHARLFLFLLSVHTLSKNIYQRNQPKNRLQILALFSGDRSIFWKVLLLPMADKGRSTRAHSSRKNPGKVPKGISKAEREKMKREHLNDLFLALANALEVSEQTNGKACILGEGIRTVKDTLEQIECRKRENAALLTESQYVTSEKNELQDEISALQDQIEKLQNVLKEGTSQLNLDLNITPPEHKELDMIQLIGEDHLKLPTVEPALQQPPAVTPVFVIPVCPDFQVYREPEHTTQVSSNPRVSKPHARYPSPGYSWPSHLL